MQKSDLDNANPTILNVSQLPSRAQKRSTARLGVDSKYDRLVLPNQHWSDTSSDDGEGHEELADDALDEQEIYGERPRTAYSVQQRQHTTHCTKHIKAALAPVPKPSAQRPAPQQPARPSTRQTYSGCHDNRGAGVLRSPSPVINEMMNSCFTPPAFFLFADAWLFLSLPHEDHTTDVSQTSSPPCRTPNTLTP